MLAYKDKPETSKTGNWSTSSSIDHRNDRETSFAFVSSLLWCSTAALLIKDGRASAATLTFTKDVAPIIQRIASSSSAR
jgi:hypothetical protein